jgi:hypothetical protein
MADTKERTYECCGGGPADGQKMPSSDGTLNSIMLRLDKLTGEAHFYRLLPGTEGSARPEPYYQYEGTDPHALMARMIEENPHVFDEE